ncbi:glycerol dehydrogenase [Chelativorans sp. M5D2P16]|uniref:glycerol dehydrogenase n=1 Tax=Chelativorans sp. M5D2P16 TaxID=3095678 RepID=UPI002ACAA2A8|nr:glycerol dehydrogenase [Chelativorans sp. M5D2P16]MDZ5696027.1 glycerol dehydrogenase [Chelativorans sp. M5D2P16]
MEKIVDQIVPHVIGARFPGRYIQAPGLIARLGVEARPLGTHGLCLLDNGLADVLEGTLQEGAAGEIALTCRRHGGECSEAEIAAGVEAGRKARADLVIGAGGGKTLDTAKAVAHALSVPVVIVPTIAASDAPCSALAVVYREDGSVAYDHFLPRNPDLVLVDTAIIARAPARFLAAGIGDALATFYEAESSRCAQAPNCWGTHGSPVTYAIARFCRDVIFEAGEAALAECDRNEAGPALERVVEANILLSGAGFESGGVAGAHAIHHGLCELEDVHHHLHGEKVAIGVLAMLLIHGMEEEFAWVKAFCERVRLPVTLADVGIAEVTEAKLDRVAERACKAGDIMHNEPIAVSPQMVVAALKRLA